MKVAEMVAGQMASYLIDSVIINAVNFPSIPTEMLDKLHPYLGLAERMGSLMGQMVRQPHDVTITYSGDVAGFDTRVLTRAVLKGFLGSFTDMPVNFVNAPALAKDKGIKVEETISQESRDYTNLIRIKLPQLEQDLNEVWGIIFAKKHQRIVRLGRIHMDVIPEGDMLVIQNEDRPGVIGNVGTLLARHGINIARFNLGQRGGRAISMINIDTPAGEEVIEEIRSQPNILTVKRIRLD